MSESRPLGNRALRVLRRAVRRARRVRDILTPPRADATEEVGEVMSTEEVIAWRRRRNPTRRNHRR